MAQKLTTTGCPENCLRETSSPCKSLRVKSVAERFVAAPTSDGSSETDSWFDEDFVARANSPAPETRNQVIIAQVIITAASIKTENRAQLWKLIPLDRFTLVISIFRIRDAFTRAPHV